jgi:hypothetical protein
MKEPNPEGGRLGLGDDDRAGRLDQVRHRVRDLGHVLIKAQKVGCWWLSRNLLLNQSIAGFDPNATYAAQKIPIPLYRSMN